MTNLLPYDGTVHYYGIVLSGKDAEQYFNTFFNMVPWQNEELLIFGKRIITKRKTAWYADNGNAYTYSGITRNGLPWTKELSNLKLLVEQITGTVYNSCLLNLYHDGNEGMSWHADDEKDIKPNSAISSLSFGAARKFMLKHKKTKERITIVLEPGSLLFMGGPTQSYWMHSVPTSKKIFKPRINLTFRMIESGGSIIP